ncbi:MAG: septation protein IspZ [Sphingomonadales bacterium]|nr:septation protein IspZ [Sphingomonadales bacterium]
MKGSTKFIIEIGPLLTFFIANSIWGIFGATMVLMVVMPTAMLASWKLQGKISPTLWLSAFLVLVMGGITLYFNDERFIKIKPTILYGFFSLLLFYGMWRKKPFLQYIFDQAMPPLSERGWYLLTRNWAYFLMFKVFLNEAVWRNVSTDTWVAVKVFGFTTITFIFFFAQIPMIMRHALEPVANDNDKLEKKDK